MQSPIQTYLEKLHTKLAGLNDGEVANYIPELTKADPAWFGISIVTMDGTAYSVGDFEQHFTIQSISKPFVYAAALADRGKDFVMTRVGVEPSGDAFNSISLHPQTGAPMNPMINAGAIATASLVKGSTPAAQWDRIEGILASFIGHKVGMDESVYRSESDTGFRNRAIAWMLKNFGIIDDEPMAELENYFRQCSVLVNCQDLAYMAATLANGGVNPLTRERVIPAEHVERVLSVMATCGMYDYAGSWLYEVGMPAKSGVGGGIIAVLPGRLGIGIFSPPLDDKGNSVRGIAACKQISQDFHLHVFNHPNTPAMALGRVYTAADAPSRRELTGEARAHLLQNAARIKYLGLRGYLAVDGIEYIIRKMSDLSAETDCFILDLHEVEGISDSAAMILSCARVNLRDQGIAVVFSRLHNRKAIMAPLAKQIDGGGSGFLHFEDNDLAVEWCENRLLGDRLADIEGRDALMDSPLFKDMPPEMMRQVEALSVQQTFVKGDAILSTSQPGDGRIFFIRSGRVSILVPLKGGGHQRVASLGQGMNFGELALLGQAARSASVYADTDVVCYVLESGAVNALAESIPQLKVRLLENLASDLADKLRRATKWVAALA